MEATIAPAAFVLRPGVLMPDWSLISAVAAKQALDTSFRISNRREKWSNLPPAADRVWRAILHGFRETGRAPDAERLAETTGLELGLEPTAVPLWLRELARRDLVVLDPDGTVSAAYPFCAAESGHRVHFGDQFVNSLCAIDALGAGAMFGRDTKIESSCQECGTAIRVLTGGNGFTIERVVPAATVIWAGLQYAGGCAATSGCKVKVFFCCDEHLRAWRDREHPSADGLRLTVEEAGQVGRAMFVPMLAEGVKPHSR